MSVIIFGRSLFIDKVDVPRLLAKYDTIGFNYFGQHYDVDYLFQHDRWCPHGTHKNIFYPSHLSATLPKVMPPNAVAYDKHRQDKPLGKNHARAYMAGKSKPPTDGRLQVAFHLFTPSVALCWAIQQGYKTAYLVGIDHVETDTAFKHHDGQDKPSVISKQSHQRFKQYVYNCTRHIKIFQTNPAVAKDWRLPFMDIEALY